MHLRDVETAFPPGPAGETIRERREAGQPYPEILHLIAYKPGLTEHLLRLSQAAMRGDSPLSAGQRELIAAVVSKDNGCHF